MGKHVPNWDARILNKGVLLIDAARWREQGLTKSLETWLKRMSGVKTTRLALSLQFRDGFDILDWRWNVVGLTMVPPARCTEEARILHWAGPTKPGSEGLSKRLQTLYGKLRAPY